VVQRAGRDHSCRSRLWRSEHGAQYCGRSVDLPGRRTRRGPQADFPELLSARPDACAAYGRVKYTLETFFLRQGHTIVRPGLVIGNGGLFGRNLRTALASPVIPLFDNGADRIPVIALRDFVQAMQVILDSAPAGAYGLFNPELVSMRQLMETVGRIAGRHPRYISIRSSWALFFLAAMKRLRIPFPSNVDNLKALKLNQDCIHRSDLLDLLPAVCSLEEMVQDALLALKKMGKNKS
jgi:NADH dehydrogenase